MTDLNKYDAVVVNGYSIRIPRGLTYDPKANRDDYISYVEGKRGVKDLMHHFEALTTLLAPKVSEAFYDAETGLPQTGPSILHAFGGLGVTAQVIDQIGPPTDWIPKHTFWERSQSCVDYLSTNYGKVNVKKVGDSHKEFLDHNLNHYDVIIFDPSLGTIKTPGVVKSLETIAKFSPRLMWISDFAVSKLHLNGRSYAAEFGHECFTAEEYAKGYDDFLRSLGLCITGAVRDSFEMYFTVEPAKGRTNRSSKLYDEPIRRMT